MGRNHTPQPSKKELSRKQAMTNLKKALPARVAAPSRVIGLPGDLHQGDSKILIATVMWRRPEIFEFWAQRTKSLGCDMLVVGSEGARSRQLAEKHGCIYLECPNSPLGEKFNSRVKYFLAHPKYTHLLLLGSDDIICSRTLSIIEKKIQRYDIVSWMDIYYYQWETGRLAYMPGYQSKRKGEPLAPARCLSRRVIKALDGKLWDASLRKSPDFNLWGKLKRFKNQTKLWCKDEGCAIVDIKTSQNINSWEKVMKSLAKRAESIAARRLLKNIRLGKNVLIGKNVQIGEGTVLRSNIEIRDDVIIGKDCYIDSGVIVTGSAVIGDNVTVRNYVVIARGSRIGDNSFLAPRVMFNNLDVGGKQIGGATIGKNCFIGTNVVLHHGIDICDNVKVGALSFVNRDISEEGTYIGQPAKKITRKTKSPSAKKKTEEGATEEGIGQPAKKITRKTRSSSAKKKESASAKEEEGTIGQPAEKI